MGNVKTRFVCIHCGRCCFDERFQVNLTFGDIARLSAFSKLPPLGFFRKGYALFQGFYNIEKGVYDVEFGLRRPCSFRRQARCSVYIARPLNCRIFPYFLLAKFSKQEITNMGKQGFLGMLELCPTNSEISKYSTYSEKLGKLILEESQVTDKVLSKLKSKYKLFPHGIKLGTPIREEEAARLKFIEQIISRNVKEELIKEISKTIEQQKHKWLTSERLSEFDNILR